MIRTTRTKPRRKGKPTPRIKPKRGEDLEHLNRVRELPCCICGMEPSEAHHIRDGQVGMGQKASDYEAIPLCFICHRVGPYSIHHMGTRAWEEWIGKSQRDFMDETLKRLDAMQTMA